MTVEDLLREARELTRDEQLRLLDELLTLLRRAPAHTGSVRALRGLGREIWDGTDAQEYVNRERDSWGG